jgi:general secretion pathway protein G
MILSEFHRRRYHSKFRGFTLVELLVVILILAVLVGLLLPAIQGALRTARKAAVSAEINQLASALAAFKSKYGDYPPSRILVCENGDYGSAPTTAIVAGDITYAQLAQRTVAALRKFFPRMALNTSGQGPLFTTSSTNWYDFNGDGYLGIGSTNLHQGSADGYILQGHECLTLFLGGVPNVDASGNFGMSGFDKNPVNPFTNNLQASTNYGPNRQPSFFEFIPSRLFADPNDTYGSMVPGYIDSLGNAPGGASGLNFFAYFSAYGNGAYDPNDVNFPEMDVTGSGPIGLNFQVPFTVPTANGGTTNIASSYAPNPYTSTLTVTGTSATTLVVTYINAQSFQIISSGIDGLYGVGGQYQAPSATTASSTATLPLDTTDSSVYVNTSPTQDPSVRQREQDNLTNFKAGSLQ